MRRTEVGSRRTTECQRKNGRERIRAPARFVYSTLLLLRDAAFDAGAEWLR
jgi:hypothetical protein